MEDKDYEEHREEYKQMIAQRIGKAERVEPKQPTQCKRCGDEIIGGNICEECDNILHK
jgi:hypothetical protein